MLSIEKLQSNVIYIKHPIYLHVVKYLFILSIKIYYYNCNGSIQKLATSLI
jgi:hypothetical protein